MSNPSIPPAVATHDAHGNSPAAWTGVVIIAAASVVAGLAVVFGAWILFGIAAVAGPIIGGLVWKLMADAQQHKSDPVTD
jgi:hypothetical protein